MLIPPWQFWYKFLSFFISVLSLGNHSSFTVRTRYWTVCCAVCLVTQSSLTLWDPMDCSPPDFSVHGDSPGRNTGVGCHDLLQGISPIQGSKPGLLHCRRILYYLSQQRSPRILQWVAYPFSRGSSGPCNQNGVSCIAGGFFTNWAIRKAAATAKSLQSCPTLWDAIDGSPPGSPIPGIL